MQIVASTISARNGPPVRFCRKVRLYGPSRRLVRPLAHKAATAARGWWAVTHEITVTSPAPPRFPRSVVAALCYHPVMLTIFRQSFRIALAGCILFSRAGDIRAEAADADIRLENGTIIDGTGRPPY